MKKLISFILCMTLVFASFGSTVFAADEKYEEYTWVEAKEALDEINVEGSFESLPGTGLKMWIPDFMFREQLDPYDIEDGEIAYWTDEEGEREIEVFYSETDAESLEEYAEELAEYYDTDEMTIYYINGRETIVYTDEDLDTGIVSTVDEGGKLVDIWFTPLEDEEFAGISECLAMSVSAAARDRILPNTSDKDKDLFTMTWEEAEKKVEELKLKGRIVTFDDVAVQMWIPDEYVSAPVDSDSAAEGTIACFTTEEEDCGFKVDYVDAEGTDLDGAVKLLEKEKAFSDIEKAVINGNTGVIYTDNKEDSSSVIFETEQGCFFRVTMFPVSDEEFQKNAILAFASILTDKDRVLDILPKEVEFFAASWQEAQDYIEENKIEGRYIQPEGIDISLWVPNDLVEQKEEKTWKDEGILGRYEDKNGNTFTITYKDAEGADLYGKYEEEVSETADGEYFDAILINGLAALSYSVNEEIGYMAYETEAGYILTLAFETITDPDFLVNAQIIIYSMLPGDYAGSGTASDTHKITVVRGEDLFEDCPKTAKTGEKVTVKTCVVTDGELIVKVTGTDTGKFVEEGLYEFIMPDEDVEISASVSTAGYPGS